MISCSYWSARHLSVWSKGKGSEMCYWSVKRFSWLFLTAPVWMLRGVGVKVKDIHGTLNCRDSTHKDVSFKEATNHLDVISLNSVDTFGVRKMEDNWNKLVAVGADVKENVPSEGCGPSWFTHEQRTQKVDNWTTPPSSLCLLLGLEVRAELELELFHLKFESKKQSPIIIIFLQRRELPLL